MFVDLHLHTNYSDGTYRPEELARQAKRHELQGVALTDHDTVAGCARMEAACRAEEIEFVPGCELTSEWKGHEIHLLGYFIDTENPSLLAELAQFQKVRQRRVEEMVGRLNRLGVPLRSETVFKLANCQSPGRPHVARALVQERHCHGLDEAFERFLKWGKPAWVPKFKISAADAIELLHGAQGLVVMAHPGLNRTDEVIPALADVGLDGLECFHSRHSTSMTEYYLQMADRHGLLVTGGSDCHGLSKGQPLIGTIKVPYTHLETLRRRWSDRHNGHCSPSFHSTSASS